MHTAYALACGAYDFAEHPSGNRRVRLEWMHTHYVVTATDFSRPDRRDTPHRRSCYQLRRGFRNVKNARKLFNAIKRAWKLEMEG